MYGSEALPSTVDSGEGRVCIPVDDPIPISFREHNHTSKEVPRVARVVASAHVFEDMPSVLTPYRTLHAGQEDFEIPGHNLVPVRLRAVG